MIEKDRDERGGLAAAYRQGLGLAAIAVLCAPGGTRIAALPPGDEDAAAAAESIAARWWCRAGQAERLAAAATARMRRESKNNDAPAVEAATAARAGAAVLAAAKRLGIALQSDEATADTAMQVVARIDAELETLQRGGGLKSVNQAYRNYRIETTARGERVLRYDQWMGKYRENLVRQVAATLRGV